MSNSSHSRGSRVRERKSNSSQSSQRSFTVIKLRPEGDVHSTSGKFDSCAFVVHCGQHKTVLVNRREDAIWMPFTQLPPKVSWVEGALYGLFVVLHSSNPDKLAHFKDSPPYEWFKCLQVLRVQMPQTQKFITRLIYYFKLKPSTDCCKPISTNLEWLSLDDIKQGEMAMWGPELFEYCSQIGQTHSKTVVTEFSLEEAFPYVPRSPPRNEEEKLLKSLHITEMVVERMYGHFLEHVYPSFYQCLDSFKSYMNKFAHENDHNRLARLFNAFDYTNKGFLSFHEFLLGLACMEPSMEHSEFRIKFIFRYYDVDKSGTLSSVEVRSLLADLNPDQQVEGAKVDETIRALTGDTSSIDCQISQKHFTTAIESQKLCGTSVLCRSSKSIFNEVTRSIAKSKYIHRPGDKNYQQVFSSLSLKRTKVDNTICANCVTREYEVGSHLVRLHQDDHITSKRIAQVTKPTEQRLVHQFTYSKEWIFDANSEANTVLSAIRQFNSHKKKPNSRMPFGFMQNDPEELIRLFDRLYIQMDQLLDSELKCHRVYSPCFVIGDIHGNLGDLLSMEKVLWKQLPCISANYLFLGDYVDRGRWSLECVLYLICFKILCPTKVTLLRGNHEVRSLQERYSYLDELHYKYGNVYAQEIFECTNKIFDKLPVCALLNDTIYCAHGGIPRSMELIEQVEKLPIEVANPLKDSSTIWEILWSDPVHQDDFLDTADKLFIEPLTAGGFVPNIKRHAGFMFNEEGATKFLKLNNLTHIVRAHEAIPLGYLFHFDTKCLTLFSCSHYCGHSNICACILVEDSRIRVIQVDTANNDSATDGFSFPKRDTRDTI